MFTYILIPMKLFRVRLYNTRSYVSVLPCPIYCSGEMETTASFPPPT